jgi:hypothetical protein
LLELVGFHAQQAAVNQSAAERMTSSAYVPHDLSRQLLPTPPHHRDIAIGGHVGIKENGTQILRDVIHLHDR